LEKIVQLKSKDREAADAARRVLALVQTIRGDYQELQKALALVGGLEDGRVADPEKETAQDRRTQAQLLAIQRNRTDRRRALAILQNLVKQQEATLEDRFLLAQLHESLGDWPKAQQVMLVLLSQPRGDNPRYLAPYIRGLLRHELLNEAG